MNTKNVSADQIIDRARAGLGTPYVWGGDTTKGWDCSGFVLYVLRATGAVPKNFPDTNAHGIWTWAKANGNIISVEDAFNSACALVFRIDQNTRKMNHVGFASRGSLIEARGKKFGTVERDNPGTLTHATTVPGII